MESVYNICVLFCVVAQLRHSGFNQGHTSQVHLIPLDLTSSGRYRCEVSGEAPSFTTVAEHGDMVTIGEYTLSMSSRDDAPRTLPFPQFLQAPQYISV